eukprot:TRINITY_DN2889_c0_g1_i1.p1 TRINITY_DN2889_c0_g1~~TRINITY_DN2889_c0_g1_i1.p1  ORF type:complete len:446 (+),score=87.64 TRINITY_DN2889_c0_g1_i1:27-1340(+)
MEKSQKTIAVTAIGSWGDVLPYVVLAEDLHKKGYRVIVGAAKRYEDQIVKRGVEFLDIPGDMEWSLANTPEGRDMARNPSIFKLGAMKKFMYPMMESWFKGVIELAKKADVLVLATTSLLAGFSTLEAFPNLKSVVIYMQPNTPSQYYAPPALSGESTSWFNWINSAKWKMMYSGAWSMWKDKINELRKSELNLPPIKEGFMDHLNKISNKPKYTLTAYSNHLFDRPADWAETEVIIGPICQTTEDSFEAPKEVVSFLESGEAPVYIGMGSMMNCMFDEPEQHKFAKMWVDGINQLKKRAIIALTGFAEANKFIASVPKQENIFFLQQNVPHSWLFPKCCAAVHHGGAGTTHSALLYGLPSFIMPVGADQPFNGDLVYRKKLGPEPVKIRSLNTKKFVQALQVLFNPVIVKNAKEFSEKVLQEQGLAEASKFILNLD